MRVGRGFRTVALWTSRRGTRESLVDAFVVMANGAAAALHDSRGR